MMEHTLSTSVEKKKGQEVKNKNCTWTPKKELYDKTNWVLLLPSSLLSSLGKDMENKVHSAIGTGLPVMTLDVTCETAGLSVPSFCQ